MSEKPGQAKREGLIDHVVPGSSLLDAKVGTESGGILPHSIDLSVD